MKPNIPFQTTDWDQIPVTEHQGETGIAYWKTVQYDGLRIRRVEYSKNYKADHWCEKGHIIYCIEGTTVHNKINKLYNDRWVFVQMC